MGKLCEEGAFIFIRVQPAKGWTTNAGKPRQRLLSQYILPFLPIHLLTQTVFVYQGSITIQNVIIFISSQIYKQTQPSHHFTCTLSQQNREELDRSILGVGLHILFYELFLHLLEALLEAREVGLLGKEAAVADLARAQIVAVILKNQGKLERHPFWLGGQGSLFLRLHQRLEDLRSQPHGASFFLFINPADSRRDRRLLILTYLLQQFYFPLPSIPLLRISDPIVFVMMLYEQFGLEQRQIMLFHMFLHYLVHHLLVGPVLLVSPHQLNPAPSPDCLHQLLLLGRRIQRAGRSLRIGMREQGLDLLD